MKITPDKVAGIIFALNWNGHIELPDMDIKWMAQEIAHALTGNRRGICENCGGEAIIIIKAIIGDICEDCIAGIGRLADDQRKEYEDVSQRS